MAIDKDKLFSNRNIILLMIVLFACWLLFFDQNSYIELQGLDGKIKELEAERDFYKQKIAEDSLVIRSIQDSTFLEKYVRENFFYTRSGEVLYILEDTIDNGFTYNK